MPAGLDPTQGMDPVSRDFYLQQKSQEVEISVKEQEANFAKGGVKGLASSVPEGAAALVELFGAGIGAVTGTNPAKGLTEGVAWYIKNKLLGDDPKPGEAAGYDAGNVTGNLSQLVVDPLAAAGGGLVKAGLLAGLARGGPAVSREMALAKAALEAGESQMDVWKRTGWFNLNHGVAGAPIEMARHIDISGMSLDLPASDLMRSSDIPLTSAVKGISHVFSKEEYAGMFKEYKMRFEDLPLDERGYHDPNTLRLVLNSKLRDPKTGQLTQEGLSTLSHEMQHAIQWYEGWAGAGSNSKAGGPAEMVVNDILPAVQREYTQRQARLYEGISKQVTESFGDMVNEFVFREKQLYEAIDESNYLAGQYQQAKADPKIGGAYLNELHDKWMRAHRRQKGLKDKLDEFTEESNAILGKAKPSAADVQTAIDAGVALPAWLVTGKIEKLSNVAPEFHNIRKMGDPVPKNLVYKIYKQEIGEAWARVAGRTQKMTSEEMTASPPWRHLDVSPKSLYSAQDKTIGYWAAKSSEPPDVLPEIGPGGQKPIW